MGIAEEVLKVIGQRSRSYVYKCVNAMTVKAYILTVACRDSLVLFSFFLRLHCTTSYTFFSCIQTASNGILSIVFFSLELDFLSSSSFELVSTNASVCSGACHLSRML